MLRWIELLNVGPAPTMRMDLEDRLNVVTGDNGLGKSFILDVAWWALTRTWASIPALPLNAKRATMEYVVKGKTGDASPVKSKYVASRQEWPGEAKRPAMPGIVLYVRIDGGFSVWDPARNYWRKESPERPAAYHFDNRQIWDGLKAGGLSVCEGLERDWVSWQNRNNGTQFEILKAVLKHLSPPGEALEPGQPRRVYVGEGFDRPTLKSGGEEIPVMVASAGVRRALALAYLLVWAWHEHRAAAQLIGKAPESRFTVLIDEPETHLHPRWQRQIIPSLLKCVDALQEGHGTAIQLIIATHSPMVLASLEPIFEEGRDALFHLRMDRGKVVLDRVAWAMQGDVTNWLVSDVFGLSQARSVEAEQAVEAAEKFMRGEANDLPPHLKTQRAIDAELRRVLAGHDPFWPRWIVSSGKSRGGRQGRPKAQRA